MEYDVRLEQHARRPLAVVLRRANLQQLSQVVPDACGAVWGVLRGQPVAAAGRHVAVYLDDAINLEIGVEIAGPFTEQGEVIASATPAGRVATTTHFGPYNRLHQAHEAIHSWCAHNSHKLAGPNWEIYGHWQDEWNRDPKKIRTEVCYLLGEHGTLAGESAGDRYD